MTPRHRAVQKNWLNLVSNFLALYLTYVTVYNLIHLFYVVVFTKIRLVTTRNLLYHFFLLGLTGDIWFCSMWSGVEFKPVLN